jgi:hypothetical protein
MSPDSDFPGNLWTINPAGQSEQLREPTENPRLQFSSPAGVALRQHAWLAG